MDKLEELIDNLNPSNDIDFSNKLDYFKKATKLLKKEKVKFNKLVKEIDKVNESEEEIDTSNLLEELEEFTSQLNNGEFDELSLEEVVEMYLQKKKMLDAMSKMINDTEVTVSQALNEAGKIKLDDLTSILDNEKEDIEDNNDSEDDSENDSENDSEDDSDDSEDDLEN